MIEVKNLCKEYEKFKAVNDISFNVGLGDVLGFLGPNGAGKSTTMKIISGFIPATSGEVRVCGKNVREDSLEVKRKIGYLPESAPSYKDMKVTEFLDFVAETRGFNGKEKSDRVEEILRRTFLEEVRDQMIDTLSKGFRQRAGFAQALIHDPPVLILDEPTDGLDPNQKHEVRRLIKDMSKEKAIILSTHILEEMEAVCNRTVIIDQGSIVADSTPRSLLEKSKWHRAVQFEVRETGKEFEGILERLASEFPVERSHPVYTVFPKGDSVPFDRVMELTEGFKSSIASFHVLKGKFDEVFRGLTGGEPEGNDRKPPEAKD